MSGDVRVRLTGDALDVLTFALYEHVETHLALLDEGGIDELEAIDVLDIAVPLLRRLDTLAETGLPIPEWPRTPPEPVDNTPQRAKPVAS